MTRILSHAVREFSVAVRSLSVLVGVAVLIVTLLLWLALSAQDRAQIERQTEFVAASVKTELTTQMQERILALVRNAKRWENGGKPLQKHWEADAELLVQHFGGYQAIEWVDPSFYVRSLVPLKGNEAAQNLNLALEKRRRRALEAARNRREVTLTQSINLVQGGKGFIVYVPIFEGEKFDGFIIGVFRTQELFDTILHENITHGYASAIFDGNEEIYHRHDSSRQQRKWVKEKKVDIYGVTWRVQVWPSQELLAAEESSRSEVVLVAGIVVAILLARTIELAQKAQLRAKEVELVNQELKREISDRSSVEKALRESEERFRLIAETAPIPIVISRLSDGVILYANSQMGATFGLPSDRLIGCQTPDFYYETADRHILLNELSKTGDLHNYEVLAKKADGNPFWVVVSIQPLTFNSEPAMLCAFYDITERKQALEALSKSQQQYQVLVNWIDGIVWEVDVHTFQFTFVSQKAERLFGYPVESWLSEANFWENHIHPEDREWAINFCAKSLQEKMEYEFEYRMIAADGRIVWLRDIVNVVVENNQPVKLRGVMVDITRHKQVEEALREEEEKYRLLFWRELDAIILFDAKTGEFLDVNNAFLELYGYSREEALNLTPALVSAEPENTQEATFEGSTHIQVRWHKKKDGTVFPVELCAGTFIWKGRKVMCAVARDITERRRMEEEMRHTRNFLQATIDHLPVAVFVKDGKEDRFGQFRLWNKSSEMMFGLRTEQVIGKTDYDFFPIEQADFFSQKDRQSFERGTPEDIPEEPIDSKSLGRRILHTVKVPIYDENHSPQYLLCISEDITERKQAQEALRENQRFIQQIADTTPDLLYIYDLIEERNIYVNRQVVALLGYTPEELQQMSKGMIQQLMHPDDIAEHLERRKRFATCKKGEFLESEYRMKHAFGEWRWLYSRDTVFTRTPDGKARQILGTAQDITKRKRTESELQEANEKLRSWVSELEQRTREITLLGEMSEVLQACFTVDEAISAIATLVQPLFPQIPGGVFMINDSKNLIEAVATWGSTLTSQRLFTPDDCWGLRRGRVHWVEDTHCGVLCKHLQGKQLPSQSLCVPMMAQGEALGMLYLSSLSLGRLTPAKQQLAVAVAEHIALALANLKLRETLQNQSIRDPLTDLFNRRYLEESLERELLRSEHNHHSVGIIMLDVDHFKRFNDTFGHEAGDAVLRELGLFLQRQIRRSDIACRYGGEEFTLILPEASLEVTKARAEQIREGVKHLNVQHRRQPLGVITLSLGVACFPEHGLTGEAVIQAADAALYQAKAGGRDRVSVCR